jgi:phage tail-like protein
VRFTQLRASPDLVGQRVWVTWTYLLDPLDTPEQVPSVLLRRKTRDFAFPPLAVNDPYLRFDSANPPASGPGVVVTELPRREEVVDSLRVVTTAQSAAEPAGPSSQPVETLRWTTAVAHDRNGVPVSVTVRVLDAKALEQRTAYYYELDDGSAPSAEDAPRYRAVATPGGAHGANKRMYDLLPEVYKRHDVRVIPPAAAFPNMLETRDKGGQLRRFVDMFGIAVDAMRSSADGLLDIHDVHATEARFLPGLSHWVGWERTDRAEIPAQRNELLSATRLYDVVGTVPALRAIVTQQTGWSSQVAEFQQHLWRTGDPPQRLVQAMEEVQPGIWVGVDDASGVLAFPAVPGVGTAAAPASITSGNTEPFALRPGMELTLVVDGGIPTRVRFGPGDFADITQATAAEVAAVLAQSSDALDVRVTAGAVELRTRATGPGTSIGVETASTSVVGVDGAAGGAAAPVLDAEGRIRVFAERHVVDHGLRALTQRTFAYGEWAGDLPLDIPTRQPSRPAAATLPDQRVALAWSELEGPVSERLRMALGVPSVASPAVVTGSRRGPFELVPGQRLTLTGDFGTQAFVVNAGDYANPGLATTAEVVAAMNAQLAGITVSDVAGAVRLVTSTTGPTAWLTVSLAGSTAAHGLGLAMPSLRGVGAWEPGLQWSSVRRLPAASGPVDEAALAPDPLGGLRACWAEHRASAWEVRQAHWSERVTVATGAGVAQRTASGGWQVWLTANGLASNTVRAVAVDATGSCWFATPLGVSRRRPDNVWTTFTTADGLMSDDVRDVAVDITGAVVCATPAGVSVIDAAGAVTTFAAATSGLVDDDVRAVTADPEGGFWAASPGGVSRLGRLGVWTSWTAADGLTPGVPRRLALARSGRVAVATAAGIGVLGDGTWATLSTGSGLPSDDVRGVAWTADGVLVAATSAGLARWDGRRTTVEDTASGLASNDLRSVAVTADDRLLVGSAAGLVTSTDAGWVLEGTTAGLPAAAVEAVHADWSAPVVLSSSGGGAWQPSVAVDTANRTWVVWSRRDPVPAANDESHTLRLVRFDPAAPAWGWSAEQAVTTAPPTGARDHEPSLLRAGGGFRVFFSSDRGDGRTIWWTTLDAAGNPGPLASLPADPNEASAPAAVPGPGGRTWLLSRSDRSVSLGQLAMVAPRDATARPSQLVPDAGSLTLRAGSRTVTLGHASRLLGRRHWGDLLSYTAEHPQRLEQRELLDTHIYTRRTIGLYLRQARNGKAITREQIDRLLQVVRGLLPVNMRLVVFISPDPVIELVYTGGADISDSYFDALPLVELLEGLDDEKRDLLPEWAFFLATDLASLTTLFADLTTARRRTWFPDLS